MSPSYPDLPTLTAGLRSVLTSSLGENGTVTVVRRKPNVYQSTALSEIVTCRVAGAGTRRLFCKYCYGPGSGEPDHRGGVTYEADVYDRVLQPLRTSTPQFYGTACDAGTGRRWGVYEYLDRSLPLQDWGDPEWLRRAARWVAQLHTAHAGQRRPSALAFLRRYDARYYRAWVRRALRSVARLPQRFAWLPRLAEQFVRRAVPWLLAAPTVIHGEYYPVNVLVRGGVIYPVDWESAAWAAGEIDLASLTENWPARLVRQCEQAYCRTRWPEGTPPEFARRLEAARLYWVWRWLAGDSDGSPGADALWYLKLLEAAGRRLGWI